MDEDALIAEAEAEFLAQQEADMAADEEAEIAMMEEMAQQSGAQAGGTKQKACADAKRALESIDGNANTTASGDAKRPRFSLRDLEQDDVLTAPPTLEQLNEGIAGEAEDEATCEEPPVPKAPKYSLEPLEDQPCMAITSPVTGERVYLPMADSDDSECSERAASSTPTLNLAGGLLSRPISELLQAIDQKKLDEALAESDVSNPVVTEGKSLISNGRRLWTEKYNAKNFMDLLSDGSANREVLRWLKSWDECVFGVPGKQKDKTHRRTFGGLQNDAPPDNRPENKVILIAGPPGVGKTTMVHVLAKHCGYRSVEINASDDRSVGVLTQRIEDATQMQSLLDDKRPNCIILDEIDGVDSKGTINAILNIVERGSKPEAESTTGKRKKRPPAKLRRPIICMCNDPYVPALYNLRQSAQVFTIKGIDLTMLTNRLDMVCQKESMKADRGALSALAEQSGRDVRSCLNTLQFVHTNMKGGRFKQSDLDNLPVGQKDSTNGLFDVWDQILFSGQKKGPNGILEGQSFNETYDLVSKNETQKVLDGLHENSILGKYADPLLEKTVFVSDWAGFSDILTTRLRQKQEWGLMKYLPCVAVATKMSCNSPNIIQLQLPSSAKECQRSQVENGNMIQSFLLGLSPECRATATATTTILDLASPLTAILSPAIKPGSALNSQSEKEMVADLADTMLRLGLTWKRSYGEDYQQTYLLEPNVASLDVSVAMQGEEAKSSSFTEKHKQMLAHEIELERMRRLEATRLEQAGGQEAKKAPEKGSESHPKLQRTMTGVFDTPTAIQPTELPSTQKKHVSIQGYVQRSATASKAAESGKQREQPPVFFRFQEGFSNAVRRTVYCRDFMTD